MASIDLNKSYKNVCKYCGLIKMSRVQGNFVCGKCKKFCKQSLSEEELKVRNREVEDALGRYRFDILKYSTQDRFICKMSKLVHTGQMLSNEQYLSVKRILKKENNGK